MQQGAAGRRHGEVTARGPQTLEIREGLRVRIGIAAETDRQVVAAVFALDPDGTRQPPYGRVIEQQRFDERLDQVDEVVVAPHVREFVGEDRFDLGRRQSGERAHGQQHDGLEPADHGRHLDARGFEQPYRPRDPQPARQPPSGGFERGIRRRDALRLHPLHPDPPGREPQRQRKHSDDPPRDEERQPRFDVDGPGGRRCAARRRTRGRRRRGPECRGSLRHAAGLRRSRRRRRDNGVALPHLHGGHDRHRRHQRQRHGPDDVAHVGGAAAQQEQQRGGERANQGALPDEVQQGPADGLRDGLLEQISRGHGCLLRERRPGCPGRLRRSGRAAFGFPRAPRPSRAGWRAPA